MTKQELAGIEAQLMEIEAERSLLLRQLDTLGAEKHSLLLKKHGIEIGMLATDGKLVVKVTETKFLDGFGTLWVKGYLRLKDGTFGEQIRHLYGDWKRV